MQTKFADFLIYQIVLIYLKGCLHETRIEISPTIK